MCPTPLIQVKVQLHSAVPPTAQACPSWLGAPLCPSWCLTWEGGQAGQHTAKGRSHCTRATASRIVNALNSVPVCKHTPPGSQLPPLYHPQQAYPPKHQSHFIFLTESLICCWKHVQGTQENAEIHDEFVVQTNAEAMLNQDQLDYANAPYLKKYYYYNQTGVFQDVKFIQMNHFISVLS